ncbi:MAG: acryloyl-CoA reductase [Devosiaceae bacterium]|nr:acryloyl-CoA reductase [Devosiaceae bacterium]
MKFSALLSEKNEEGRVISSIKMLDESDLPKGNVLVKVEWAGLNYKDGLCLNGAGGLVRNYPHVAGIDFAGMVQSSSDERYKKGDKVILTGWRVGENRFGGYAELARVEGDYLVPLPKSMSTRDAMVIGTAGLTAQLAISRLKENGLKSSSGEILVTGAGGGVGSIATLLLANENYEVVGVTGREETKAMLKMLGVSAIMDRSEIAEPSKRVLESERWAGVIDSAGGESLGNILKAVKSGAGVALIGLAGGVTWNASVIPFIIRGVNLYGIDSVMAPFEKRQKAWKNLAQNFDQDKYAPLVSEVTLEQLPEYGKRILKGEIMGRVIVQP